MAKTIRGGFSYRCLWRENWKYSVTFQEGSVSFDFVVYLYKLFLTMKMSYFKKQCWGHPPDIAGKINQLVQVKAVLRGISIHCRFYSRRHFMNEVLPPITWGRCYSVGVLVINAWDCQLDFIGDISIIRICLRQLSTKYECAVVDSVCVISRCCVLCSHSTNLHAHTESPSISIQISEQHEFKTSKHFLSNYNC